MGTADTTGRAALLALVSLLVAAACSRPPSNTGFVGLWERGGGAVARSEISIWEEDGRYRFRVNRWGPDGRHHLRCGRDGPCLEFAGETAYYEYRFRAFVRDGEDALFVECDGTPLTRATEPVDFVERYSLLDDGLTLEAVPIEHSGVPLAGTGPGRRYTKLSDDPFD